MSITRLNNNLAAQSLFNLNNLIAPQLKESLERLSTGLRINRSADDASGLRVANELQTQIAGLNEAFDAAQSGVNVANVADQGLSSITDRLQRIRELTVQAGNTAVYDQNALQAIQTEINANVDEINRIAETTQFGQNPLLNGAQALTAGIPTGSSAQGINVDESDLTTQENFFTVRMTQEGASQITAGEAPGEQQVLNSGIQNTQDIAVTLSTFNDTAGGAAQGTDALSGLTFNSANLENGGTIAFQGTLADGTTGFTGTLSIDAGNDDGRSHHRHPIHH